MNFIEQAKLLGEKNASMNYNDMDYTVSKANYDKTYYGIVTNIQYETSDSLADAISEQEKIDKLNENKVKRSNYVIRYWEVFANGQIIYIKPNQCDIRSIGERVRLYIPNNDYSEAYAEVINRITKPDKIIFRNMDDEEIVNSDDGTQVAYSTSKIIEWWDMYDGGSLERVYTLTVKNRDQDDEEVISMTCPDGFVIWLEGFYMNNFGGIDSSTEETENKQ